MLYKNLQALDRNFSVRRDIISVYIKMKRNTVVKRHLLKLSVKSKATDTAKFFGERIKLNKQTYTPCTASLSVFMKIIL